MRPSSLPHPAQPPLLLLLPALPPPAFPGAPPPPPATFVGKPQAPNSAPVSLQEVAGSGTVGPVVPPEPTLHTQVPPGSVHVTV